MRICIVYDCLYPYTVGGAERWYRNLAERLVQEGHQVSYLTLRQWPQGKVLDLDPRIKVHVAGPRMELYSGDRRRILPPVVFGIGVLWHLLRHGRRYDAVHSASFPYFSLLAAGLARALWRFQLIVDWHEVWSREYWREYLGPLGGAVGHAIQRLCARIPQRAFCFSQLHAARIEAEGLRGAVTILRGQYAGQLKEPKVTAPEALVLFAGRLIPEKRAMLALEAVVAAAGRIEGLRTIFYGEGPERTRLLAAIRDQGLQGIAQAPGFAAAETLEADLRRSMCMLLPSAREGYGKIVVEAAAAGTPSVVVAGEDNAATELIEQGKNGLIADRPDAQTIADAIVEVAEAGMQMRYSTAHWLGEHARELSLEASLATVLASYAVNRREPAESRQ